jgi:DNA-directed RNA polymerase specialized sigma24 family protein
LSNNPNRILAEISDKLSKLIVLSSAELIAQKEIDQKAKVVILTKAGFTSEEIGDMLDIRADSVRRLRSKAGKD